MRQLDGGDGLRHSLITRRHPRALVDSTAALSASARLQSGDFPAGMRLGEKNLVVCDTLTVARRSAIVCSGIERHPVPVPFVQKIGPYRDRVTGMQSVRGNRGWRVDWDPERGFHVDWWDRTGGSSRDRWMYGAYVVEGGTPQDFHGVIEHFPAR